MFPRVYLFRHKVTQKAGVEGLEPSIYGTKNRCLAIWPYPINAGGGN